MVVFTQVNMIQRVRAHFLSSCIDKEALWEVVQLCGNEERLFMKMSSKDDITSLTHVINEPSVWLN